MYASDYGYSVKNSSCNHSSTSLLSYGKTACGGSAWMLKNAYEWTLSTHSIDTNLVFYVGKGRGRDQLLCQLWGCCSPSPISKL